MQSPVSMFVIKKRGEVNMKKVSKIIPLLIVAVLLVCSACGTPAAPAASEAPAPASDAAAPASDAAAPASDAAAPADDKAAAGEDFSDRTEIVIGMVNSYTGGLAGFTQGSPWVDNRAVDAMNKDGGIFIKSLNKKLPVRLEMVDTESDPTKASEVTSKLILEKKVDLILCAQTPDNVNPVCALAERYEVPCIASANPFDPWMIGGPYKWSFDVFWKLEDCLMTCVNMWKKMGFTEGKVGILHPNDADGTAWFELLTSKLPNIEGTKFEVIDPGTYTAGTKDFTSIISMFKEKGVEVVMGVNIPPDFATFWKQCKTQGFKPKIVSQPKAYLFKSDILAMGPDLSNGLTSELWWSAYHPFKSSLLNESAKELCDAWEKESGKEWVPPLGYNEVPYEIAFDALTRAASLNKEDIRAAIAATDIDTIVGHVKFDGDNFARMPIIGTQWVKDGDSVKQNIISTEGFPEIQTNAEPIYPLP